MGKLSPEALHQRLQLSGDDRCAYCDHTIDHHLVMATPACCIVCDCASCFEDERTHPISREPIRLLTEPQQRALPFTPPVHTSGSLTTYPSGATRSNDTARLRYDLCSPIALEAYAERMALGAQVHGDRNWEKGLPASACVRHLLRHLVKWMAGDRTDDHLAAVLWNAAALVHIERSQPDLIDLPSRHRTE